jgi:hypothetical protein
MDAEKSYTVAGDEVKVWVEQEAIHIKAISGQKDPAEITKQQALELSEAIKRLANSILE